MTSLEPHLRSEIGTAHPNTESIIREYLAEIISNEILYDEGLYCQAKTEIFDNASMSLDPNIYLFDEQYYTANRGVPAAGISPIRDYFNYGAFRGFSPHPLVSPSYIAEQLSLLNDNPRNASLFNPLHTLFCLKEHRVLPNILFDNTIYAEYIKKVSESNVDVGKIGALPPVVHYLKTWRIAQRSIPLSVSKYFDPQFYNLQTSRHGHELVDPLTSYYSKPITDRNDCNSKFHGGWYQQKYGVRNMDPLHHFLNLGAKKGYLPNPFALSELGLDHLTAPADLIERILLDYVQIKKVH